MTLEFLVLAIIISATPGTGVIYTIATGLSRGAKVSIIAAFSCTLGVVPHLLATLLGLAAILHTSSLAFNLLKCAGIVYLLYMAWQMLRDRGGIQLEADKKMRSYQGILLEGILINLLNPKLSLFFLAFLPQFITPQEPQPMLLMLSLSAVFMLTTFLVFCLYGIFAGRMRYYVIGRPKIILWLRRGFAASFTLLALKLLRSES